LFDGSLWLFDKVKTLMVQQQEEHFQESIGTFVARMSVRIDTRFPTLSSFCHSLQFEQFCLR